MKSTFRVLFFLKRDKVKKNGNMPIVARITIDGKPQSQLASAKLIEMFEEFDFWRREVKFFP